MKALTRASFDSDGEDADPVEDERNVIFDCPEWTHRMPESNFETFQTPLLFRYATLSISQIAVVWQYIPPQVRMMRVDLLVLRGRLAGPVATQTLRSIQ